jgi:hypothetical protein
MQTESSVVLAFIDAASREEILDLLRDRDQPSRQVLGVRRRHGKRG